jgi:hypothetical protein
MRRPVRKPGPRIKRRRPEDAVQEACIKYTLLAYPGLMFFHVPNEKGNRTDGEMARLTRLGVVAGVADLVFCLPDGRFAAIEIKAPNGRLSDSQKAWLPKIRASNGLAAWARSVEAYSLILAAWLEPLGVKARCRLMAAADPSKGGFFCLPGEAIP